MNAHEYFTANELQAVLDALVVKGRRGHKIVSWRKSNCKWGTPGYIAQQARVMATATYRMPSQTVCLFDREQYDLLMALSDKFSELRRDPELGPAVTKFLIEEKLAEWREVRP